MNLRNAFMDLTDPRGERNKHLKIAIKMEASFESTPAVNDGIVYIGNRDVNLYAIDFSLDPKARRRPTI